MPDPLLIAGTSARRREVEMKQSFELILLLALLPGVAARAGDSARTAQYAGSKACIACHEQRYKQFEATKMGKIFLKSPRTELEAVGCESCHGPAQAHVEAGGGRGVGLIGFGKNANASVDEQNAQCLQCHEKGMRLFWRGSPHESRGLTCVTCHQVMQRNTESVRFQEALRENQNFVKSTELEVCFQCHPMRRAQLLRSAGGSTPLLCLEGGPDLPVAPEDEAGLTKTFQTYPRQLPSDLVGDRRNPREPAAP